MTLTKYDCIIADLKHGGYPSMTGMTFTKEQVEEIKAIFKKRRENDEKFIALVETRQKPK